MSPRQLSKGRVGPNDAVRLGLPCLALVSGAKKMAHAEPGLESRRPRFSPLA